MNKSESIKELACALSELQSEITDVPASSKGHRHDYADLSDMLKVARPLLKKHGLAVTQLVGNAEQNVTVESILMHKSGEWVSSMISVPVMASSGQMNALQSIGSSITYARRYALGALLNYTKGDDDTDGHAQLANTKQAQPKAAPPVQQQTQKAQQVDKRSTLSVEQIQNYVNAIIMQKTEGDMLSAYDMWSKLSPQDKAVVWKGVPKAEQDWLKALMQNPPKGQYKATEYASA